VELNLGTFNKQCELLHLECSQIIYTMFKAVVDHFYIVHLAIINMYV
jgi:hypothetical protein